MPALPPVTRTRRSVSPSSMCPASYDLAQMTRILLVRHGETDWNRDERWQGHAGPSLNQRGRAQAEAVAARLAGRQPAALVTSDLPRAVETAEVIAEATGLRPSLDAGLREVDVGSWSGLTREEAELSDPDGYARWDVRREWLERRRDLRPDAPPGGGGPGTAGGGVRGRHDRGGRPRRRGAGRRLPRGRAPRRTTDGDSSAAPTAASRSCCTPQPGFPRWSPTTTPDT